MSNTLLTVSMIVKRAVAMFRNTNSFIQLVDRQYEDEYRNKDFHIGTTLRIRLPVDYTVGSTAAVTPQASVEKQTTLVVGSQKNVSTSFTSADFALSIDDFEERFLKKMVNNLVAKIAQDVMSLADGVPNIVHNKDAGTGATKAPTMQTFLDAGAVLDNLSADRDGERKVVLSPNTNARVITSLAGLFNPTTNISEQYRKGSMSGTSATLGVDDWRVDQTILNHTTGTFSAGGLCSAPPAQGAVVIAVSAITGTLKAGDIVTFTGVNAVNRLTKQDEGFLQQFVVTAASTNGDTTINVYPAFIGPTNGEPTQYQTVAQLPTNASQMALATNASEVYRKNLLFRKEAFALVMADLPLIRNGVVKSARESYDGCSLRMVEGFDVYNDLFVDRIDALYGYASPRPDWAVIIADSLT